MVKVNVKLPVLAVLALLVSASLAGPAWADGYVSSSVANANNRQLTVGPVASLQAGDVLIASFVYASTTPPTTPSGWTPIATTLVTGSYTQASYYKVAGDAETGTYTFRILNGTKVKQAAQILAYRGVNRQNPVSASAQWLSATSVNYWRIWKVDAPANAWLVGIVGTTANRTASTDPAGIPALTTVGTPVSSKNGSLLAYSTLVGDAATYPTNADYWQLSMAGGVQPASAQTLALNPNHPPHRPTARSARA